MKKNIALPLILAAAILATMFSGTIVDAGHRVFSRSRTRTVTVVLPDGTVVERTRYKSRTRGIRGNDFGSCAADTGSCAGNDAGGCDSGLWLRW